MAFILMMIKFYDIKTHTYTDPALSTQPICGKVSAVCHFFFFVPVILLIMYLYCF